MREDRDENSEHNRDFVASNEGRIVMERKGTEEWFRFFSLVIRVPWVVVDM